MNFIKNLFKKKNTNLIPESIEDYKITFVKDGYLKKEYEAFIYAKNTHEAIKGFFEIYNPAYFDILKIEKIN